MLPDGSLRGPGGAVYHQTPKRVTRRIGRELVAAGAVLVTDVYPDGLGYYEGEAAAAAWRAIEPFLITGAQPPVRDIQWVGRVWESDGGGLLLRFDGQH